MPDGKVRSFIAVGAELQRCKLVQNKSELEWLCTE